jgi:multisubunit Na+/H+ antiporter MnhE subunit
MAYAAALIAGAAAFWLALSPAPFALEELIAGAVTVMLVALAGWRLGLLDREGAPYLRAPGFAALMIARAASSFGGNLRLAGALSRADMKLYPALVRLKLRAEGDSAAAALGGAITLEPGLLAVDCDADSMLVHALVEDDADETDLRGLERLAASAVGEKVRTP